MIGQEQRRLLTLCAMRVEGQHPDWSVIARQAQRDGGLDQLCDGEVVESSPAAARTRGVLTHGLRTLSAAEERLDAELTAAAGVKARLVTVLEASYPANLRLVPDLPPFLFLRGRLHDEDARAVAIVGSRNASREGLARADRMARILAGQDVTVVSGLARGIDTAAHNGALAAGGRTIAVLGTGITRCYPPENAGLAERIAEHGVLVSQFWPTAEPARHTFPLRNVVTSGISQGTVVIEAGAASGARMQARIALAHGKRLWLVRSLVETQPWARRYVEQRGAVTVDEAAEMLHGLAPADRVWEAVNRSTQLTLELL